MEDRSYGMINLLIELRVRLSPTYPFNNLILTETDNDTEEMMMMLLSGEQCVPLNERFYTFRLVDFHPEKE
eukprot:scaffold11898_cov69-Cyclotella_meneghiniana.AAC.10